MQKTYTIDHLEHRRVNNNDLLVPQYYLKDHHEPIISREEYAAVRHIFQLRDSARGYVQYPYFGYLVCPFCGAPLVSCRLHSVGSPKAWVCSGHGDAEKQRDRSTCKPFIILESVIDKALAEAILSLKVTKQERRIRDELTDIRRRLKETDGKIAYKYLHLLVKSITFPTWDEMEVTWKMGGETRVPVKYDSVFYYPYPETGDIVKGKIEYGGFLLNKAAAASSCRGFSARQRFIGNLLIKMPDADDEFQIPYVKDGEKTK